MHIDVHGTGPALVLIHGWALHGGVFDGLVANLREHFELHVVDLPGHGLSRDDSTPLSLPFVVNAIAAATPPAVWCGWSLGGLYALHAAATLPKVRGVAMMSSLPRFIRGDGWPNAVDGGVLEQFAHDLVTDYAGTLGRFLALDIMGSEHTSEQLHALRTTLTARGQPDPDALQQGMELLGRTDLRGALAGLDKPGLWLAGQRDRLVQARAMHDAATLSPAHHRAVTLPGGHAPFLGSPELVANALRHFVSAIG